MTNSNLNDRELLIKFITQSRPNIEQIREFAEYFYIRGATAILRELFLENEIGSDMNQKFYRKEKPLNPPVLPPVIKQEEFSPWKVGSLPKCSICGMIFDGPMGYVCINPNCPSQIKVTMNVPEV